MVAVDASGTPLPIQPEMGHSMGVDGPEFAVLADGTMYEAPAYEFPEDFFIHTLSDGSMVAVDASGTPLPIQPEMGHSMGVDGPEFAVLADGTMYEAPAYEFPEDFFIHTFPDGSMVAVDASGTPLPIQPELGHGGPEMAAESDYAVLSDGTMYIPPPLYPPAGEPPDEWPPPGWGVEDDETSATSEVEDEAEGFVEAAIDQGPDRANADSDEATSLGDSENLWPPIGAEAQGEIAAGDELVTVSIDDARSDTDVAAEVPVDSDVSDLLTAGLVETPTGGEAPGTSDAPAFDAELVREALDPAPGQELPVGVDEVSATPITLPGEELPVGVDEVSATPITLPGEEFPVGGEEVSTLPIPLPGEELPAGGDDVSATPITLPSQEFPVGGDEVSATPITLPGEEFPVGGGEVSATPITLPEPPSSGGVEPGPGRSVDDEIALDRKGDDAPVGVGIDEIPPVDVEFAVESVEEVHVEEVRFEEIEVETVESIEPAFDPEISVLDEEGIEDLDA